mmetsp:Transcript_34504/g.48054  ORF Transcript_34504/g.48054 Transcript_34504/m.48054 type:complete len:96 (-) Transcript_34504:374-661(-)
MELKGIHHLMTNEEMAFGGVELDGSGVALQDLHQVCTQRTQATRARIQQQSHWRRNLLRKGAAEGAITGEICSCDIAAASLLAMSQGQFHWSFQE